PDGVLDARRVDRPTAAGEVHDEAELAPAQLRSLIDSRRSEDTHQDSAVPWIQFGSIGHCATSRLAVSDRSDGFCRQKSRRAWLRVRAWWPVPVASRGGVNDGIRRCFGLAVGPWRSLAAGRFLNEELVDLLPARRRQGGGMKLDTERVEPRRAVG